MNGGNQYNEKWTLEECEKFLNEAIEISEDKEYDFIGEVAKQQDSYKDVYFYIIAKFPDLKNLFMRMKSNCESNCFNNGKKGNIVPSLAIMNLKSNHNWTDRVETNNTHEIKSGSISIDKWISE